jgi:shikimate dehydrogenase
MIVTVNHDGRVIDTEVVETSGNRRWTGAPPASRKAAGPFGRSATRCAARPTRSSWSRASSSRATTRSRPSSPAADRPWTVTASWAIPWSTASRRGSTPLRRADRRAGAVRQALLIPLDGFAATVRAFRRRRQGLQHHRALQVRGLCDALVHAQRPRALAGACNILRFDGGGVMGDNTDGIGLVRDIQRNAGRGAGRPRRAADRRRRRGGRCAGPAARSRPRRLVLANRTWPRPRRWWQRMRTLAEAMQTCNCPPARSPRPAACGAGFDVVINGTASSLAGAGVPVAAGVLKPGRAGLRHDVRPGRAGLPALGRDARRTAARRPGHAGGAGGRSLPRLARRAALRERLGLAA